MKNPIPAKVSACTIDSDTLSSAEIDIRQDLVDCRIDICTPDVLGLWSDNFDNQSLRQDFLHGILKDYELNGKTVHTYIVKDHYAARIGDLLAYNSVSRDMQQHWSAPLTIENNLFLDNSYSQTKPGVYQEPGVIIARPCHIGSGTIIGRGTSIGANSNIKNTVIGRRCHIGKNVSIEGAYLWDDVSIGNNVSIVRSIIANEAVIGDKSSIAEGALISFGVRVSPNSHVSSGSRLTKTAKSGHQPLRPITPGLSHEYEDTSDIDSEEAARTPGLIYTIPSGATSTSSLSSNASVTSDSAKPSGSRSESFATSFSDDGGTVSNPLSPTTSASQAQKGGSHHHRTTSTSSISEDPNKFHAEAVSSLFHRLSESANVDDVVVELMGLRFATNASEDQVRRAVAVAIMKYIQHAVDGSTSSSSTATHGRRSVRIRHRSRESRRRDQDRGGQVPQAD